MSALISEHIIPKEGTFSTTSMGRGEPGLPTGFTWRDQPYRILHVIRSWKQSAREGGKVSGGLYLRRHYYQLRMDDDSIWTVYFLRQTPKSGSVKARWFLYTIENSTLPGDARNEDSSDCAARRS
ncbi:MAG: hypothetical protein JSV78_12930 [Phycisphaerales bacterium]|nr:MAG: hypothetical protein JSV78_12930 [Phycisphaerales bacterium]